MEKNVYVKPVAHAITIGGNVVLADSGTEGWNEKPGLGTWHSPRNSSVPYDEAGE